MKKPPEYAPFTLGHYVLSLWLVAFLLAMYFLPDKYSDLAAAVLFPGVVISMFLIPEDRQ